MSSGKGKKEPPTLKSGSSKKSRSPSQSPSPPEDRRVKPKESSKKPAPKKLVESDSDADKPVSPPKKVKSDKKSASKSSVDLKTPAKEYKGYDYRLYVKNKDCKVFTATALHGIFEKYALVIKASVGKNSMGKLKGDGEVIFNSTTAIPEILSESVDGLYDTGEGKLYVSKYEKKAFVQRPVRGVFFRNLPEDATDSDLESLTEIFSPFGEVDRIFLNHNGVTGSVLFKEGESGAKLLTDYRENNKLIKFQDSVLALYPYSDPRKRMHAYNRDNREHRHSEGGKKKHSKSDRDQKPRKHKK